MSSSARLLGASAVALDWARARLPPKVLLLVRMLVAARFRRRLATEAAAVLVDEAMVSLCVSSSAGCCCRLLLSFFACLVGCILVGPSSVSKDLEEDRERCVRDWIYDEMVEFQPSASHTSPGRGPMG